MTTKILRETKLTEREMEFADVALDEYEKYGTVQIHCPRCSSELKVLIGESSERITCIKCDFRMTTRGI